MHIIDAASREVPIGLQRRITADQAAQVTTSVFIAIQGPFREGPGAHQLVVDRQVRSTRSTALRSRDVLPATVGQEAMIAARDKRRSVLQRGSIRRLDAAPMGQDAGLGVAPVETITRRAINLVAGSQLRHRSRLSVSHQNWRIPMEAERTSMLASAIRID